MSYKDKFIQKATIQNPGSELFNIFSSEEMRAAERRDGIDEIDISLLDEFPNHPYLVRPSESLSNLIDSMLKNGQIEPIIVRTSTSADGRYEIISGHRRSFAAKQLNWKTIKAKVIDVDDDEAKIMMVDSNIHRDEILPSEKAHAYKMKLDAMKHQGERRKASGDGLEGANATSAPVEQKFKTSREELAVTLGESQEQLRRYIRLNELIKELLDLCDTKELKLRPAVELSYLPEDIQMTLYQNCYNYGGHKLPTYAQAHELRDRFEKGMIVDQAAIDSVMEEPNVEEDKKNFKIPRRLHQLIPFTYKSSTEKTDYICEAIKYYQEHHKG